MVSLTNAVGSIPTFVGRHQAIALLSIQFRRLDAVMNCMLTVPVSQVSMVCRLFVLLGLIVFCCLVS